jgi:fatty-acyl-CoA synthase
MIASLTRPQFDIQNTTIGDLTDIVVDQFPENKALIYSDFNIDENYTDFRNNCNNVAKGLIALGIEKGENIAIWANNIPHWIYMQFGSAKMGATLVTVNTSYRTFELEYLLKQSDSTSLVLIGGVRERNDYIKILNEICPELKDSEPGKLYSSKLPKLRNIIFIGEEELFGAYKWDDMVKAGESISDEQLNVRQESTNPDDVINIQYTSGTTGFPKGAMLTHTNLIANAVAIGECMEFTNMDKLCIPVPFFHCFGCVLGTLTCVTSAAAMAPVIAFDAGKVLQTIEETRATALHGVPTMFIAELEEMKKKDYDLSLLRTGIMAGATCPIEIMKQVIDKMGISDICITYGQTEASPAITMTKTNDNIEKRVSTVGKNLPGVEVKVVSVNYPNREVAVGEKGELCCRGYNVMKGYYNNPEATLKAIDEDNWLHTGDMTVRDECGYFKILGRIDDTIIRGGENIYPKEIEEFLYTHPKIKDVNIVGIPSQKYGEEVCAFIQTGDGHELTHDDIKEFSCDNIAYFKIPSFSFFVDKYPTTTSGKIQKFKLKEQAINIINRDLTCEPV